jgi:hypothetical protein
MVIDLDPVIFPERHVALCSQRQEANLSEAAFELAYESIAQSEIWESLPNSEWDRKAEELAGQVLATIDVFISNQSKELSLRNS